MEEPIVETNLRAGGWVLANDHLESARHQHGWTRSNSLGSFPIPGRGFPDGQYGGFGRVSLPARPGAEDWKQESDEPPLEKGTPLDVYVFRAHR